MQRTKPPFRADHVGSLLRSARIKEARAKHGAGEISGEKLREIEDSEIKKIIHKQQDIGFPTANTAGRGGISISWGN